jgi:hypothetical protein
VVFRPRASLIAPLVFVLASLPLLPSEHVHATESADGDRHGALHAHSAAGPHCHHAHATHRGPGPVFEQGAPESFAFLDDMWIVPTRAWPSAAGAAAFTPTTFLASVPLRRVASVTYEPEHYIHGPPGPCSDPRGPPPIPPAL